MTKKYFLLNSFTLLLLGVTTLFQSSAFAIGGVAAGRPVAIGGNTIGAGNGDQIKIEIRLPPIRGQSNSSIIYVIGNKLFSFPISFQPNSNFNILALNRTTGRICNVENGSGNTGSSNIRNIIVNCGGSVATPTPKPSATPTPKPSPTASPIPVSSGNVIELTDPILSKTGFLFIHSLSEEMKSRNIGPNSDLAKFMKRIYPAKIENDPSNPADDIILDHSEYPQSFSYADGSYVIDGIPALDFGADETKTILNSSGDKVTTKIFKIPNGLPTGTYQIYYGNWVKDATGANAQNRYIQKMGFAKIIGNLPDLSLQSTMTLGIDFVVFCKDDNNCPNPMNWTQTSKGPPPLPKSTWNSAPLFQGALDHFNYYYRKSTGLNFESTNKAYFHYDADLFEYKFIRDGDPKKDEKIKLNREADKRFTDIKNCIAPLTSTGLPGPWCENGRIPIFIHNFLPGFKTKEANYTASGQGSQDVTLQPKGSHYSAFLKIVASKLPTDKTKGKYRTAHHEFAHIFGINHIDDFYFPTIDGVRQENGRPFISNHCGNLNGWWVGSSVLNMKYHPTLVNGYIYAKRFHSMAYSAGYISNQLWPQLFMNVDYQTGFGLTQGSGYLPTEFLQIIRCWKQRSIMNRNQPTVTP